MKCSDSCNNVVQINRTKLLEICLISDFTSVRYTVGVVRQQLFYSKAQWVCNVDHHVIPTPA
jgi:hypothetical protein